jgi:cystathionine beta-lyase/cystathionine gamma-synthase
MADDDLALESRLVHAGLDRTQSAPLAAPLVQASAYVSAGEPDPARSYGRTGNPTWEALESALGGIEDAECLAFASGQAATMAVLLALAPERARVVLPVDGYYNVRALAERLRPTGTAPVLVDQLDLATVERALGGGPSILWVETPTNPLLRVADLAALARMAARAGAAMVVDNTVATGVLQRPLDLGATACMTSLTKAASGHADLLLGAVTTRDRALLGALREWRTLGGGIPGPHEAWLAVRGLRTAPLRIRHQSESAGAIARHLAGHARVRAVHYPGLDPSTRAVAERQMPDGFGPLLSFELDGDAAAADAVVAASRLIVPATSFGGVESTWERRARWASETASPSLIRLSVGIEALVDLVADIDASLATPARA